MQKCQTFQHWLYQWTNGSFLVTDLAGMRVGGAQVHGVEACGEGRAQRVLARSQPRSLLCVSDFIITEIRQRLPFMQPLALPQPGGPSL